MCICLCVGLGGDKGWGVTGSVVEKALNDCTSLLDTTVIRLYKDQRGIERDAEAKVRPLT